MIPYTQPRGAVHDLARIGELSAERTNLLCVSDRSLYIIQNWAALDVDFLARYVVEFTDHGYVPVSPAYPAQYILMRETANSLKLEVEDMSCDVVAALAEIRDAIAALSASANASSSLCCNYTIDPGNYYDPAGEEGEPALKCDLAWSYANAWAAGAKEFYHQWAMGAFPSIGVLSAILDSLDLPAQIILEIVTFGASHAVPYLESAWAGIVDSLVEAIACAVYTSPGSASAIVAIEAAIDAVPDLHPSAVTLLKGPIAASTLNQVYAGTFPISGGPYDCQPCQTQEGALIQTSFFVPFNILVIGDAVEFNAEDPGLGYQSQNSGQNLDIYFTLDAQVPEWHFEAEVFSTWPDGDNFGLLIQRWDGQQWGGGVQKQWLNIPGQTWTPIEIDVLDDVLPAAVPLRAHLTTQGFNLLAWWRKVLLIAPIP